MKRAVLGFVAGLSLTNVSGCKLGELFNEGGPINSVQIVGQDTLTLFRTNWLKMEQCTGRTRNFDKWTYWMYSDSIPAFCSDKERGCAGGTDFYRNRIYLRSNYVLDEKAFGHEQVRALMGRGAPTNSDFERCGVYSKIDGLTGDNYLSIER